VGLTERRIGLLFAIFLGLLALAGGRTLWLGGVKASALQRAATTQQVNEINVPARRGAISDRNGLELAVSEPAADIAATPYLVKSPLRAAARLAPLLDRSQADVLEKLSVKGGFVYLARNLPADKAEKIRKLDIAGLEFIPSARRDYPRRWLASQVIGSVGVDGTGLGGLELAHDSVLHGTNGTRRIVKDGVGEPIVLQETKHAVPGKDLRLTLDAQLQGKVEDVLQEVGAKWKPKGATAVVMDPRTSAVLALANWPRVDANDLGGAPAYAAQNRAVGFNYEPGSTFKAFTVAGALEEGAVSPEDIFHLPPTITVADRTIEEAHERGTVDLTTAQILAQSSNVGTVRIGLRLGATKFDKWVRRFGFGRRTGIELEGEEAGQVLARNRYSGSSMGNLPIGQGESVTPIQLATAYAAIADGGVLRRPRIIGRVDGRPTPTPPGRRVISQTTAARVRAMLAGVVETGGTATAAAIPGYTIAGKTGTANKIDFKTGTYSKTRFIGSFVGFAPASHPKLLVTIMVDEPQGEIYGAEVAAPAFQEIMRFALPYLRIAPG
jgi:cell division protein FtsI/penicillin-binding protein 2